MAVMSDSHVDFMKKLKNSEKSMEQNLRNYGCNVDGFYGILMGCKEFYGVLVEFIKERNFHGNLTGFSCWMLGDAWF